MGLSFVKRLKITPNGSDKLSLYSTSGTLLSVGYCRVVIGKRGPYIEFNNNQIKIENFHIPEIEKYRIENSTCFYIEYRSNDTSNVKLYLQKRHVSYADYKIGKFYISPFDLYMKDNLPTII